MTFIAKKKIYLLDITEELKNSMVNMFNTERIPIVLGTIQQKEHRLLNPYRYCCVKFMYFDYS